MSQAGLVQSSPRSVRSAALGADAVSPESIELAKIWSDLAAGRARAVDGFYTATRCLVVLEGTTPDVWFGQTSSTHSIRIVERVLLGRSQKAIALDLDRSPSTVAVALAECLQAMGFPRRVGRVPVLVSMAVHACHASQTEATQILGRVSRFCFGPTTYRVVSCVRPDLELEKLLSPAECAVVRLLIEGRTHADIAALRRASTRTVANQLATAFQKLGTSGRSALVCALLRARAGGTGDACEQVPRLRALARQRLADVG